MTLIEKYEGFFQHPGKQKNHLGAKILFLI